MFVLCVCMCMQATCTHAQPKRNTQRNRQGNLLTQFHTRNGGSSSSNNSRWDSKTRGEGSSRCRDKEERAAKKETSRHPAPVSAEFWKYMVVCLLLRCTSALCCDTALPLRQYLSEGRRYSARGDREGW